MDSITKLVKKLVPPVLYEAAYMSRFRRYGWFGNFASWSEAAAKSSGYNSTAIVDKVKDSTIKVIAGEFPYERDSVLFENIEYDWPVLASLLWVAAQNNGTLNVIDFGGSLGSTFWQNRRFLASLDVKWNIVEQENYVQCAEEYIHHEKLSFYDNLEGCLAANKPNVLLLSSVLSYLEHPFQFLQKIFTHDFPFIIIDRLLTIDGALDRITVQKVPPYIYQASYPCWFFSKQKFEEAMENNYELVESFQCQMRTNIPSSVIGYLYKKRSNKLIS